MPKALLSPSHTWKNKNLFLWSRLRHASKPAATKNGLSLRKACVTPVWPCCLLSPPSLLERTQDLRRRGGKLIHSSWRQWLHVCVFKLYFLHHSVHKCMHMLTYSHLNKCIFSQTVCTPVCVCVSRTNTNKKALHEAMWTIGCYFINTYNPYTYIKGKVTKAGSMVRK